MLFILPSDNPPVPAIPQVVPYAARKKLGSKDAKRQVIRQAKCAQGVGNLAIGKNGTSNAIALHESRWLFPG